VGAPLDTCKEVGQEVNAEKTKRMVMSHHHTTGQNHHINVDNKSFENVAVFKYLGMTVTNQICIYKEIKCRLNLGNAYYHTVQNHLFSHLLFKNVKNKIFETKIIPAVLYKCETWSV
jgi:hypothetical protein